MFEILGLCKNEKNYRVFLQIDAYGLVEGLAPEKVGGAQYNIYPRVIHPKVDVHTDLEENMFRVKDVSTLSVRLSYNEILNANTNYVSFES